MPRRLRKFVGTVVMLTFVIVYALLAMTLAQTPWLQQAGKLVQGIFYLVAGLGWVLPLMPLIRWMERPDPV